VRHAVLLDNIAKMRRVEPTGASISKGAVQL